MNTDTGEIHNLTPGQEAFLGKLVPVVRDLSAKERSERQILLYAPCACGSGKKFKFCCHTSR